MNKKSVLIIDDSPLMRELLKELINNIPNFTVADVSSDPIFGAKKIMKYNPDIVTLDIEMPRMGGLVFLEKLMKNFPKPVLIVSALTAANQDLAITALELGAVDVINKPLTKNSDALNELKVEIEEKLNSCLKFKLAKAINPKPIEKKLNADALLKKSLRPLRVDTANKVIAIGASTGGTVALAQLFEHLEPDLPGIVVVQHMPKEFTNGFAERLNSITHLYVKEAQDGDVVASGQVLIAPGGIHTIVKKSNSNYIVELKDGPKVNHHRPSIDVLFRSIANNVGKNAIGCLMTGMGDDGAQGLLEMKNAGAYTIAQDEESSVIFGMPKAAYDNGATSILVSLNDIPNHLRFFKRKIKPAN